MFIQSAAGSGLLVINTTLAASNRGKAVVRIAPRAADDAGAVQQHAGRGKGNVLIGEKTGSRQRLAGQESDDAQGGRPVMVMAGTKV